MSFLTLKKYDAFITYRRKPDLETARSIRESLQNKKISSFLDLHDLTGARFDEKIQKAIKASRNLVVILSPGCFERCQEENDVFCQEIKLAIEIGINIVPILKDNFDFRHENVPEAIIQIQSFDGFRYAPEMFDESMDKLKSKLKLKSHLRRALLPLVFTFFGILLAMTVFWVFRPREPAIDVSFTPLVGNTTTIKGSVANLPPEEGEVAVYLFVDGKWWPKPTYESPVTNIDSDGNWECEFVTGGNDLYAHMIVAFLLPKGYTPPQQNGGLPEIPCEVKENALAKIEKRTEFEPKI